MAKKVFLIGLIIGFLVISCQGLHAAPADDPGKKETLQANWADEAPKIDGVLDDKVWQVAPLEKPFVTYYPTYGDASPFKTQVWMSQDSLNLYFAFMCFDPEPDKIKTQIGGKDSMFHDDWVGVCLDPLGTRQTAWALYVNPSGVPGDILVMSGGQMVEPSLDFKSAGKITDKGYQVEICIPLKSMAFKSGKEVKMGILFWRSIMRKSVHSSWPAATPGGRAFNTMTNIIYKNLKTPFRMSLKPHFVFSGDQQRQDPDNWEKVETTPEVGLGFRLGLTSTTTADVIINPDFSQVEPDLYRVETNQRYPVYYPDRRPFFTEGFEIFDFFTLNENPFHSHAADVITHSLLSMAVHTRKIVDPRWAAKITGTMGKTSIGLLATGDEYPGAAWDTGNLSGDEDQSFWGMARMKYPIGERDDYIGLFYSGHEFSNQYNRVFGADLLYRLGKAHRIRASFLHSASSGTADDSNSSNFNLFYNYMVPKWNVRASFEYIGSDFRMDSAYLKRTGVNHAVLMAEYKHNIKSKKIKWFNQFAPGIRAHYLHDYKTGLDDKYLMLYWRGYYAQSAYSIMGYAMKKEHWRGQEYNLNQFLLFAQADITKWLRMHVRLTVGDMIHYDGLPSVKGSGFYIHLYANIIPTNSIDQTFVYQYYDMEKDNNKLFTLNLLISRTLINVNKRLSLRSVVFYDDQQEKMVADFLASLVLKHGFVLHLGYGRRYDNWEYLDGNWIKEQGDLLNIERSFFAKVSYQWKF